MLQNNPATADTPIIALSANAMLTDVKRGVKGGFLHYLTKPIDIPKLREIIDNLIEQTQEF